MHHLNACMLTSSQVTSLGHMLHRQTSLSVAKCTTSSPAMMRRKVHNAIQENGAKRYLLRYKTFHVKLVTVVWKTCHAV